MQESEKSIQPAKVNRSPMFDFIKCLGCMSVVFIHVTFPGTAGKMIKTAALFAVPVFLMISGFYAFGATEEKILYRLKKILLIFGFGYILLFLYNLAKNIILWIQSGSGC